MKKKIMLIAPDGTKHVVDSVIKWTRENAALVLKTLPNDARLRFSKKTPTELAYHMDKKLRKSRWHGWSRASAEEQKQRSSIWAKIVSPDGRKYPLCGAPRQWIRLPYHMKIVRESLPDDMRNADRDKIIAAFCSGMSSYKQWRGWTLIANKTSVLPAAIPYHTPITKESLAFTDEEIDRIISEANKSPMAPIQRQTSGLVRIENFIREVRDSFIGAEHVYMNGSCFYFARLLRSVYGGKIVENVEHCYLLLRGKYYDIRGEVTPYNAANLTVAKEPTLHGKYNLLQNR